MIKKITLGLLLGFITIVSFSNAERNRYNNGTYHTSPLDNTIEFEVANKGQLMSNRFGQTKRLMALTSSSGNRLFFFWSANQKPYYYINYEGFKQQGFLKTYYLCNGMLTGNLLASNTNCNEYSIDNTFATTVGGLFDSMTINDYWGYNTYTRNCNGGKYLINQIMFYSTEYDKSIVFGAGAGGTTCVCHECGNLQNSLGLGENIDYTSVSDTYLQSPPGFTPYDTGSNNTNSTIQVTTACPTIKQLMNNFGSNYNTNLCYNNTTYFNGTSFEQVTKDDIFTIFNNDYDNYVNRISIYWNNCNNNVSTSQACQNAFSGEFKKYSIISNAKNSNVDEKKLWNYCNLGLNYDPNATTCVASGYTAEEPTTEERLDEFINLNTGIPTPGQAGSGQNNNVFDALCDPNDPTNCYGSGNVRDIFGSLESIYGKITGIFEKRNGVNGIIPDYILRIAMLTIVFTILLKK